MKPLREGIYMVHNPSKIDDNGNTIGVWFVKEAKVQMFKNKEEVEMFKEICELVLKNL